MHLRAGSSLAVWLATAVFSLTAAAAEDAQVMLSGQLAPGPDRVSLSKVRVSINGTAAVLDEAGTYSASVEAQPYYRIEIAGDHLFDSVQTFGHSEIYREACECLQVDPIELVARKPNRVELFFAGDAMAGRRYSDPIWGERRLVDRDNALPDLKRLLDPIRPYVESADLASVNLEIVLADEDPGQSAPKSIVFYSPTALAPALAHSGFDYVSLGNNHSYDFLEAGLRTTIDAVEGAGLAWSGAGFDEEQALEAARIDLADTPLSMLGYVGWQGSVEPNQVASTDKGGAAFGTTENIVATVRREVAAGRRPVVQLHGSSEYSDEPSEISETRMRAAIDAGAVVVASHHPHVTQAIEIRDGKVIAYSLGNFLFDQYFMLTHATYAMKVWLEDGEPIRLELVPIRVLDYRPVPAVGTTREHVIERVTRLSARRGTSFERTGGHLALWLDGSSPGDGPGEQELANTLVYWGDFENSVMGDAQDRTLAASGASIDYRFDTLTGTSLTLRTWPDAAEVLLQPTTFFRKTQGVTLVVTARIKSPVPLEAELLSQHRPDDTGRFDALEQAPYDLVATLSLPQSDGWQEMDFTVPNPVGGDENAPPMRTALRLTRPDGLPMDGVQIELDDLSVATLDRR